MEAKNILIVVTLLSLPVCFLQGSPFADLNAQLVCDNRLQDLMNPEQTMRDFIFSVHKENSKLRDAFWEQKIKHKFENVEYKVKLEMKYLNKISNAFVCGCCLGSFCGGTIVGLLMKAYFKYKLRCCRPGN